MSANGMLLYSFFLGTRIMVEIRHSVLRSIYSLQPFDIVGDAKIESMYSLDLTCVIPTFERWQDLDIVLNCLSMQNLPKERFEVIVVEDGNTNESTICCARYQAHLNIHLLQTDGVRHCVGELRNKALVCSKGEHLLFLDDDTRILQSNFLQILLDRFTLDPIVDCIQITGNADRCLLHEKYSYLDKFSFATRCVAYRRNCLVRIGGFIDSLKSYEDIEMSIRFILSGGTVYKEKGLLYYHPPLYFHSWDKTITNGLSFITLFKKYSFLPWLICYLNAIRFLPLLLSPSLQQRQWGKISAGFLLAPFYRLFGENDKYYH